MRAVHIPNLVPEARAPVLGKKLNQLARRHVVLIIRTYVVPTRYAAVFVLHGNNAQVRNERLKYVLVGTDRIGVANDHGRAAGDRTDAVGNDAIIGKVSPTDHVARARRGYGTPPRGVSPRLGRKETLGVRMRYELGAALGVGVRVEAIELVILLVAIARPLEVFVDLVGCDVKERGNGIALAHAFEHVDCSHDVCLVCIERPLIRFEHDWLGGKVENRLWLEIPEGVGQGIVIANVRIRLPHTLPQRGDLPKAWVRGRLERITGDIRTKLAEHGAEP